MTADSRALIGLPRLVQDFFEHHLAVERHASRNTILAYRDSLKLFLAHAVDRLGGTADQLDARCLDIDVVRSFLEWLHRERQCGARTRNHRLAALKAFVRYVASVAPEHLDRCRRIRELQPARFERPEAQYLDEDEVVALVRAVDPAAGERDRALLLLLYNTGARVQELCDLECASLRLDTVAVVTIHGKGRKQRTCPLWARTVEALRAWLAERGQQAGPLFLSRQGHRLSRSGVAYILRRIGARAQLSPRHASHLSPHVLRHTTAMHLLRAGADITTLAAWLGHSQLETTHGYVAIDLRMKQAAIANASALPVLTVGRFPDGKLLAWLASLGRASGYAQHHAATPPS